MRPGRRTAASTSDDRELCSPTTLRHIPRDARPEADGSQSRCSQTNTLMVRERQLTAIGVPEHPLGSSLTDHHEAGSCARTTNAA